MYPVCTAWRAVNVIVPVMSQSPKPVMPTVTCIAPVLGVYVSVYANVCCVLLLAIFRLRVTPPNDT